MKSDHSTSLGRRVAQILSRTTIIENIFNSGWSFMLNKKTHGGEVQFFMMWKHRVDERLGLTDHARCSVYCANTDGMRRGGYIKVWWWQRGNIHDGCCQLWRKSWDFGRTMGASQWLRDMETINTTQQAAPPHVFWRSHTEGSLGDETPHFCPYALGSLPSPLTS